MTEVSWTRGYRADREYTFGIYPFLFPDTLLLTLILQGIRPAVDVMHDGDASGRRLVYCELGCGQGMTLNLMAARDPVGQYFGVDYNPNQIRNARAFAGAAGLKNVRFDEESFADLDKYDIPDCDVIALHGIWSWIDPALQQNIVHFIRRKLKPGGVVFVSYNCAVGRSSDNPMRRLLQLAERKAEDKQGDARIRDAINLSLDYAKAGAQYFKQNPVSEKRLQGLLDHDLRYVEQEYLNASWQSYFHDEVAAAMSEAKLNFAGSVNMASNRLEMALPKEARHFASTFSGPGELELIKDMWTNNTFRQDVFVRGVQQIAEEQKSAFMRPLTFSLTRKVEDCGLTVKVPGGTATIPEVPYRDVLKALAAGPRTGAQVEEIIKKSGADMTLPGVLGALVAVGYASLAPSKAVAPRVAASLEGFETAIADLVDSGHDRFVGVIPGLGNVVSLSVINYLFWRANRLKVRKKPEWVQQKLAESGRQVAQDGNVVTEPGKALELLKAAEVAFDLNLKPLMTLGHSR